MTVEINEQNEAHGHEHKDVSGGWLRPAVFGAMDGLVTNVSLIAGVGGGGGAAHVIILTGLAGLASLLGGSAIASSYTFDIPKLPAGLVVRSISVTSQGIVATASAQNTTLSQ